MRQIFLDTETTGLSPETGDRVVEVGCVEMVGRRLTGENKHFYLNPERKNSEEAFKVHGLSDDFLAQQPRFAEVAEELMAYLAGAEIIIHNAAFDVGFLDEELRRVGRPAFRTHVAKVTDSLLMAREQFPGKANSLDALCKRLEVDNSNRTLHGALLDAGLLADVYIRLTRGQHGLAIDMAHESQGPSTLPMGVVDLASFILPILEPTPEETTAHEGVLKDLEKSSGGLVLWRKLLA
jgi:DNA polymerase-3 subunit epsilon